MANRQLVGRGGGRAAMGGLERTNSAGVHEDTDFSDLPVHFQPLGVDRHEHRGSVQSPVSDSVVGRRRVYMDSSSQYIDTNIGLAPNYNSQTPPNYSRPSSRYTSPPPSNYTTPSPANYTSPPPTNYTSPPPSSYTSPPPPSTMDAACSYNPVYQSQTMGSRNEPMNVSAFVSSYLEATANNAQCSGLNSSGMYNSSSLNSHFADHSVAGPSGESSRQGSVYKSSGVHSSTNTTNTNFGLYGESKLCSSGVNTEESAFEMNGQFSMVPSSQGSGGQGGGGRLDKGGRQGGEGQQKEGGQHSKGSGGEASTKRFNCQDCDIGFTRVDHLNRHLKTQRAHCKTEQKERQYPCPQCSKQFVRRDHMKRHMKIHVRGEPVKCVECQTWFPSRMELTHHLLDAHNVLVFECNVCSKGFFEASYLTQHLADKHDMIASPDGKLTQDPNSKLPSPHTLQLPYRCGICSLSFVHELACNKHMASHTRPSKHTADSLSLASSQLSEVQDSSTVSQINAQLWPNPNLGQDDVQYNGTTQAIPQSSDKDSTMLDHNIIMSAFAQAHLPSPEHDVKAEPCDGDSKHRKDIGVDSGDLNGHLNDLLYKGFSHADILRCMMKQTDDDLMCGICGKAFTRSQELKSHLRTHSGHNRFMCLECGASFASSSNLVRHQRSHSGEKPFKCSLCESAFSHKGALVSHERIHTGERPYVCELCDAAFARVDALSRHRKTHKEYKIKQEGDHSIGSVYSVRA